MKLKAVSLGFKLRSLRINANMKQKDVAEKVGVSPATISDYENDKSVPSTDVLRGYITLFNSDANWLLEDHAELTAVLTALNKKDLEMVRQYQTFTEEEKRSIRQLVKVMYDRSVPNDQKSVS